MIASHRLATRSCGWTMMGTARAAAAGLVMLLLAGCAGRETVMMQHPQTNEIAQCAEGYRRFIGGDGYRGQEDCIADYERRGYQRSPGTPGR